jgi:uncharacterized damage-inducible protein DinB
MTLPFPSPSEPATSRTQVLERYLDFFRARLLDKLEALPPAELRRSRLPSGWTPLELLWHVTNVERRWLVWGFEGQPVDDPWADEVDGRWHVPDDVGLEQLVSTFHTQVRASARVVAGHDLDEVGRPGPRWDGEPPATLERVLLHLVQEYARHLGQLDVVAELAGGPVGE